MTHKPLFAGQLATPGALDDSLVKVVMDWTPIDDIGNFSANGSAGSMTPMMRKVVLLGEDVWLLRGRINTTGITAATTFTLFTFDLGHRVASERGFSVYAAGSLHHAARLGFNSNGTLTVSVPSAAGNNTTIIWLDGCVINSPAS